MYTRELHSFSTKVFLKMMDDEVLLAEIPELCMSTYCNLGCKPKDFPLLKASGIRLRHDRFVCVNGSGGYVLGSTLLCCSLPA